MTNKSITKSEAYIYPQSEKDLRKYDIIAAVLILISAVWLALNCKFGTALAIDEPFYLTIPKRLLSGDGLLTDEWQLSQLSSAILLPLVKLWYMLHGNAQGMYITFCYLFAALQGITGGAVYALLRKYRIFAIGAALGIMHFSVMNISGLSYNTIGLSACVVLMCLIFRMREGLSIPNAILSGAVYALLVLCNPFTVFVFPFYVICAAVFIVREKSPELKKEPPFCLVSLKGFLCFVAGIIPVFAYFMIILIRNSAIGDIIKSIPYILSDPEHSDLGGEAAGLTRQGSFIASLAQNAGIAAFVIFVLLAVAAIAVTRKSRTVATVLSSAGTVILFVSVLYMFFADDKTDDPGLLYFVFASAGFLLYFLGGRRSKAAFYIFICGGFAYAVFMNMSSNLGYHAQINGYACALPGVMILVADTLASCRENDDKALKTALRTFAAIICLTVTFTAGYYAIGIHGDVLPVASSGAMEFRNGFYKGKYMYREEYERYAFMYSDIQALDEIAQEGDRVLVINNLPSAYLDTDKMKVGSMSAWLFTENQLDFQAGRDRFFAYYELFPENTPDYIYIADFGVYSGESMRVYPKKIYQEYVAPYFDGELIELNHGVALKVSQIGERTDK